MCTYIICYSTSSHDYDWATYSTCAESTHTYFKYSLSCKCASAIGCSTIRMICMLNGMFWHALHIMRWTKHTEAHTHTRMPHWQAARSAGAADIVDADAVFNAIIIVVSMRSCDRTYLWLISFTLNRCPFFLITTRLRRRLNIEHDFRIGRCVCVRVRVCVQHFVSSSS